MRRILGHIQPTTFHCVELDFADVLPKEAINSMSTEADDCLRSLPERIFPERTQRLSTVSVDSEAPNILANSGYLILHNNDQRYNTDLNRINGNGRISTTKMKKWEMNYHEASIFLQEGENNEKFNSHPKSRDVLPSYLMVHNDWFYKMDTIAALTLLLLAFIEKPSIFLFKIPIWIHGSLELLCLLVVGAELVLKLRWQGWKTFLFHKRTMIKVGTISIMLIEAVALLVRQSTHLRLTRALRPIFIIDNHYFGGVRRMIRQILQALSSFFDVLILIFFFMLLFSVLGFYLFSQEPNNPYFATLPASFINMFVLLTTANFPDVMMPSYARNKWSALFFILYLSIVLYFLMNLMLAVVYDAFTVTEKKKFRKLLLHKRSACRHAFRLLVNRKRPLTIDLHHFEGLMKYYATKKSCRDVYLMFKTLNTKNNGVLTIDEFYAVYDCAAMEWKVLMPDFDWFEHVSFPVKAILKLIRTMVASKYFDVFVYTTILLNCAWLLVDTVNRSQEHASIHGKSLHFKWYHELFVSIFVAEVCLKILALGPDKYFLSGWNMFDFFVTLTSAGGLIFEYFGKPFYYFLIIRALRLLKLFQQKKRYRDVFNTLFILLPRLISTSVVFLIVYYFFAVIGMELFAGYEMKNCCRNSAVESNYRYNGSNIFEGYYYLNNFDNMFATCVTLFELTVINNWFVIMEGYAIVTSQWSRLYFMIFYIVIMVVMTIVVAFILEAFLFRIQYQRCGNIDDDKDFSVDVTLSEDELRYCYKHVASPQELASYARDLNFSEHVTYRGTMPRTKHMLSLRMYREEVTEWLRKAKTEEDMQIVHDYSTNNYNRD